jgi:hypothetical protein
LFTQSNLTKFIGPIPPNPVAYTTSNHKWYHNGEENGYTRRTMFPIEIILLALARMGFEFVHFQASLAGCDGNATIACGFVPLNSVFVLLADEAVVWWVEARD